MMGYLLWPGYDLQKFFPVFGPPCAGKGIIIQVAADMGGGAVRSRWTAFAIRSDWRRPSVNA